MIQKYANFLKLFLMERWTVNETSEVTLVGFHGLFAGHRFANSSNHLIPSQNDT